jgi:hypothetical protein
MPDASTGAEVAVDPVPYLRDSSARVEDLCIRPRVAAEPLP